MTYIKQTNFDENYKIIYYNPILVSQITNTYQELPESIIDYIPSINSSAVIYQFYFYFGRSNNDTGSGGAEDNHVVLKLQYSDDNGSTWFDWGDNTECAIGHYGKDAMQTSAPSVKFALDTTSWSEVKKLRLSVKNFNSGATRLHKLYQFADNSGFIYNELTGTGTAQHYKPSVSCYSLE